MIDLDKIEAAAKAANRDGSTMGDIELHWLAANPAAVLELVTMIRERDAVLVQALGALERTETYLRIEVNEAYSRDAHVSNITEWQEKLAHHKGAIAAIKGVLKP